MFMQKVLKIPEEAVYTSPFMQESCILEGRRGREGGEGVEGARDIVIEKGDAFDFCCAVGGVCLTDEEEKVVFVFDGNELTFIKVLDA